MKGLDLDLSSLVHLQLGKAIDSFSVCSPQVKLQPRERVYSYFLFKYLGIYRLMFGTLPADNMCTYLSS